MNRFGFLSDGWLECLAEIAQNLLDSVDPKPEKIVTYCEMFNAVPDDKQTGKVSGFVLTFDDGKASVRRAQREDEGADFLVTIDYSIALATMRLKSGPQLDALGGRALADGTITLTGSPAKLPIAMDILHDRMIDRTAMPDERATA